MFGNQSILNFWVMEMHDRGYDRICRKIVPWLKCQSEQSDVHCKIKETLLNLDLKPALNENVGSEKLLLY